VNDQLELVPPDGCVCAEINTRHCPVHGQQKAWLPGREFEDIFVCEIDESAGLREETA